MQIDACKCVYASRPSIKCQVKRLKRDPKRELDKVANTSGYHYLSSLHAFPRDCAIFPFFFFFLSLIVVARAWRPKTSAEDAPVISIKENKSVKNIAARVVVSTKPRAARPSWLPPVRAFPRESSAEMRCRPLTRQCARFAL